MTVLALTAGIPIVALGLWLGLRFPFRGPLALYAAVVPFGSSLSLSLPTPPPFDTFSSLLGLVTIVAIGTQLTQRRRRAVRLVGAVPVFLLFVGVATASWFWSVNPAATVRNVMALLSLVVLFLLVALVRPERRDVEVVELATIAGGCLVSLYGLYLVASGSLEPTAEDEVPRFATAGGGGGGEADPNITAAALLLPFILVLTRLVRSRGGVAQASAALALALVTTGIFLTGSRGGLMAAVAGLITVLVLERGRHLLRFALPAVLIVVVAYAAAPAGLQERTRGSAGESGASMTGSEISTGRTEIWKVGARGCDRYCLVGSGYGTFPDVYRETLLTDLDLQGHGLKPFEAHNIWLSMAVETGIAGLLLGVLGMLLLLRDVKRLPRELRTSPLAAIIALLVANVFLSNFDFKYFWLVLSYAVLVILADRTGRSVDEASTAANDVHPGAPSVPYAFAAKGAGQTD